jgi:hypothetical protein
MPMPVSSVVEYFLYCNVAVFHSLFFSCFTWKGIYSNSSLSIYISVTENCVLKSMYQSLCKSLVIFPARDAIKLAIRVCFHW